MVVGFVGLPSAVAGVVLGLVADSLLLAATTAFLLVWPFGACLLLALHGKLARYIPRGSDTPVEAE